MRTVAAGAFVASDRATLKPFSRASPNGTLLTKPSPLPVCRFIRLEGAKYTTLEQTSLDVYSTIPPYRCKSTSNSARVASDASLRLDIHDPRLSSPLPFNEV